MAPAGLFFILLAAQITIISHAQSLPEFPAIFIFGDSTVDTGNNNYIKTPFKADHPPYGQNFPGHVPTGRFSDGKLVSDFLASMLGIKETLPPFLRPNLSSHELLTGVVFASAGSGYDELTTANTQKIPVSNQVLFLKDHILKMEMIVGAENAQRIINDALFVVCAGTNDLVMNFYDIPRRRLQFNISGYQEFLQIKMQNIIKELYDLGSRKIVISGLPPIGCLPVQRTLKSPFLGRCSEKENSGAQSYNDRLRKLIPKIEAALPGSKVVYADIYTPLEDMINDPQTYGFTETRRGCCGTGKLESGALCNERSSVCPNPHEYLFWDCIHPTESTYRHLAEYFVKEVLPQFSQPCSY